MLIYITIEVNESVLNLSNFYLKSNFENCKILAVDLSIISNTEDEILDFFLKFRQLYDVKIIIVEIGKKVEDIFLAKLVSNGILNFITSEDTFLQKEEISNCILGNNTYKDCVKFKITEQIQIKENNKKRDIFKGFLSKINKPKIKKELLKTQEKNNIAIQEEHKIQIVEK